MLDKKGIIMPRETLFKKNYSIIKENTAQIAIVIPIAVSILAGATEFFLYVLRCGYYKYFGIDTSLMLSHNSISIYQYLVQLALVGLYWAYTVFVVKIIFLKKNYLWKFLLVILIPFLINIIMVYSLFECISKKMLCECAILIPAHWLMIFAVGYCVMLPFHSKVMQKVDYKKDKQLREGKWGNREYRLFGIILILGAIIIFFLEGYYISYRKAVNQKRFGIVNIEKEKYAVIDANENKLILQKCEIENTILKINKNTYLCIDNNIYINFQNFNSVKAQ